MKKITLISLFLVLGCVDETVPLEERTVTTIGVTGGLALSAAGELRVDVPPGALTEDSTLSITTDRRANGLNLASPIFDVRIEPAVEVFTPPVQLSLFIESAEDMVLVDVDATPLTELEGSSYDPSTRSVQAPVTRLSRYAARSTATSSCTQPTLQAQAVCNGQARYTDGAGLRITDTLAIDVSGVTGLRPLQPLPAGLEIADYHGAVDPNAASGWWQTWTYRDAGVLGNLPGADQHPLEAEIRANTIVAAPTNACATLDAAYVDGGRVDIFGQSFPVCVVEGSITASVTWPNSHVFVISGAVNVGDGHVSGGPSGRNDATLTIEAGTQVYGVAESPSLLVITRGSRIEANGTADLPIIFASVDAAPGATQAILGDPTDLTQRGAWAGVVLSGRGRNSSAAGNPSGEQLSEVSPSFEDRYYAGSDNTDSSGTLRYAIIAESGFAVRGDIEANGLSSEAAGSGTTIEYVQIIGSEDDGIELLGGAANVRRIVVQGQHDDGIDLDEGYQGTIQFALVVFADTDGDRGLESDGKFADRPLTAPMLANVTIIGGAGAPSAATFAAVHREGAQGQIWRAVYTDGNGTVGGAFENGCFDVDDLLAPALMYRDAIFNCSGGINQLVDDEDS